MKIVISKTADDLGLRAAEASAKIIKEAIETNGRARIILSTGASQFETLEHLVKADIDWSKVEMFHLDEYVDLPETHIASFRKYLKERFVAKVPLKRAVFVNGEGDVEENLKMLEEELAAHPIDVGAIGIGENAHIAFNDPPAMFDKEGAYHVVNLNDTCKKQQVGEGWFATIDDVPKQAVSMTTYQIMQCKRIVSCVPNAVKAEAIKNTLSAKEVTPMVPATLLSTHPDWLLYIDENSASGVLNLN